MKYQLILFLFVLCLTQSQAQDFEEFSSAEKTLIESGNADQLMRVMNMVNPKDSIILKSISKPISPIAPLTHLLAERMLQTVQDPDHPGVGIAAPQVGINRRMIVVQRFDKENYPFEVFVNPEIIWASDLMQRGPEGDLSFEERGSIDRNYIITIQYQNLEGETITENLEGFTAVIYQHERDHLDGILLTNRLESQKHAEDFLFTDPTNLFFIERQNH